MNVLIVVSGLIVLGILIMAVRSDRSGTSRLAAQDSGESESPVPKKDNQKLSPHDAAVWLDDFLVKQQETKDTNEDA